MNPKGLKKDEYDVVIIGAGIGGLVCGCYLAKAGMKVLIVEQHYQVGGYCQSFRRNGFIFDAGSHALGSLREEGQIGIIFRDLELSKRVKIIRANPSDSIVTPEYIIHIRNNIEETISNFQQNFPQEAKSIRSFFEFINKVDVTSIKTLAPLYIKLRDKTFQDLLDSYFQDIKLKEVLSIPLIALTLPAMRVSAAVACIHYKEFLLDGGYYPLGGMQKLPDALAGVFKENGGDLITSHLVNKIVVDNNHVEGIKINDWVIKSKYVISNCDAKYTFLHLIGKSHLEENFITKFERLIVSGSGFCIYLGANLKINKIMNGSFCNWVSLGDYNKKCIEKEYNDSSFVMTAPSLYDSSLAPKDSAVIRLFINSSFNNEEYIKKNMDFLIKRMLERIDRFIPNISKHIVKEETATPSVLSKYTLNSEGSIRGWAALPSQHSLSTLPAKTPIEGLFLAGHWVTDPGQGGVATSVFSGRNVAKIILKNK